MISTKNHESVVPNGWTENDRVVSGGTFEDGSGLNELGIRTDVLDSPRLPCVLAEAPLHDWYIGTSDFDTTFLNASLTDKEDGIDIVMTPQYLLGLGIEEPHVYWMLNASIIGIRQAYTKWEMRTTPASVHQ